MSTLTQWARACLMTCVRRTWNNGHTVKEISEVSGKSPATVRRMLRVTGVTGSLRRNKGAKQ